MFTFAFGIQASGSKRRSVPPRAGEEEKVDDLFFWHGLHGLHGWFSVQRDSSFRIAAALPSRQGREHFSLDVDTLATEVDEKACLEACGL